MAVILAVAAVVLLGIAAFIGPDAPSTALRVVFLAASWAGPVVLLLLVALLVRRRWQARLQRMVVDIAGPALVQNMPPRTVLESLLTSTWGDSRALAEMVTAILGGAGRNPGGHDTAVSRATSAHFRLSAVDESTCINEFRWTYDFSEVHDNHKFVVFATDDPNTAGLIARDRIYPLFELWLLTEDALEDFVPTLREQARMGISYRDERGIVRTVDPTALRGEEIAFKDRSSFVRLPNTVSRDSVQIVEFDLHDLADPDHVVDSIETLSLQLTYRSPSDLGYVTWSPPHPCFVNKITFDVEDLAFADQNLVYMLLQSTPKNAGLPTTSGWERVPTGRIEVPVDSWMLPGHGITLLWRPVDGAESIGGFQRW
jgi:hypothetical protein